MYHVFGITINSLKICENFIYAQVGFPSEKNYWICFKNITRPDHIICLGGIVLALGEVQWALLLPLILLLLCVPCSIV